MVPSKLCKSCPTTTCMCFPQPCSSFNREMYPKKSCSKWTKNDANRLDIVKCGANLVLDRKVGFSQNQVSNKKMLFNPVQPQVRSFWLFTCQTPNIIPNMTFDVTTVVASIISLNNSPALHDTPLSFPLPYLTTHPTQAPRGCCDSRVWSSRPRTVGIPPHASLVSER